MNRMIHHLYWTLLLVLTVSFIGYSQPVAPTNVAQGKPVEGSSYREAYFPHRAVDGIWDTKESRWLSGARTEPPHYLEIDLQDTFVITSADVWTGDPTAPGPYAVDSFKLQYWNGTDWADIPGAAVENNESEIVYFVFSEAITTDRVRFYSDHSGPVIRVREILVYGVPVGSWESLQHMKGTGADEGDTGDLNVVRDGRGQAVIVIADNVNMRIVTVANVIADYVRKATGAQLRVMRETAHQSEGASYPGLTRLYIGDGFSHYEHEEVVSRALEGLDDQGFVIYPEGNSVRIVGPSIWGTLHGVYEFLERYVGVRWLMFGDVGEDVPKATDITVSREVLRIEPAFTFRRINHVSGGDPFVPVIANRLESLWAHRNKLQGNYNSNIDFHHNLGRLITSQVFGESNPEFFPRGNPPAPGDIRRWQPCFTADGIVEAAAARIIEFFDNNPTRTSYSLGVNDIGGYCESDPFHPHYPGTRNSIGLLNMSDIYYKWVNDVVEIVAEVHPDKWFGLLAYQEVMDPPSFPLHPRVIPFLTKDRMAWIDDDIREAGHRQMDAWNKVASQMGWYDYMYGLAYKVPRVYPRLMAETMRYARDHNVIALYTEMSTNVIDGPKPWLLSKLLWDPYADVESLLDEWYVRTVGPEAAEDLAAFYDHWERFWMERIPETAWFNNSKNNTYLGFSNPEFLIHVTEDDIRESIRLLDSVVEKAGTEKQRARAELIRQAFELAEKSALSYPRRVEPLRNEASAIRFVEEFASRYARNIDYARRRYEIIDEFSRDINLARRSSNQWFWWNHWSGWNDYEFLVLTNYLRANESQGGAVTDQLARWFVSEEDHRRDLAYFVHMALGHYVEAPSLIENGSFEAEADGAVASWAVDHRGGKIERVTDVAYTGEASLKLSRVRQASLTQSFDRPDQLIAAQVHFRAPADAKEGTIRLELIGTDRAGTPVVRHSTFPVPLSESGGEWHSLTLVDVLPPMVNEKYVNSRAEPPGYLIPVVGARVVVTVEDAPSLDVYIDDVVVYQGIPSGAPIHYTQHSIEDGQRNVAFGKPVKESSYRNEYYGSRAVDGNWTQKESRWLSGVRTPPPHWLEIDLLGMHRLDRAEIWTSDPEAASPSVSSVSEFKLQYWDGEGWVDIPGASVTNNLSEHVIFHFQQSVVTDKVRFYSEAVDDGLVRVREILVYGQPYEP